MKRYDRAYFDRWYRGRHRVNSDAEVRRKIAMAVSICEYFLRRPIRSVLDVACGEGAWRPHLEVLRPRARYLGIDPSEYAVQRYGATRNLRQSSFGDLANLRLRGSFDLVVCSDAMHYIGDDEIRAGLPELVRLAGCTLYLEILTGEDAIVGDLHGLHQRSSRWYRSLFAEHGLTHVGPYSWIVPELFEETAELERPAAMHRRRTPAR